MKYRTPKDERATYFYTGKGAKLTLRPGEDGVTEADIEARHEEDDAEFNNNKKHSRTDRKIVKQVIPLDEGYAEMATAVSGFDPTIDAVLRSEKQRKVREAVAKLPEKQRAAATAVWLEGMSQIEYGNSVGLSKSSVSHLLSRAKANLQKSLDEYR
jgi:RNA polymerase sigma factor (sigma-70 family)